jgi:hypothetical protein
MASSNPLKLLGIPAEVRLKILRHVFDDLLPKTGSYHHLKKPLPSLAALGTCRQIYTEARETLLSISKNTDLHVTDWVYESDWRKPKKQYDKSWLLLNIAISCKHLTVEFYGGDGIGHVLSEFANLEKLTLDISNRPFRVPEPVTFPKKYPKHAKSDWSDDDRNSLMAGCLVVTDLHFWYSCLPWYGLVVKPARLKTLRFKVEALSAAEFEDRVHGNTHIMVRSHFLF